MIGPDGGKSLQPCLTKVKNLVHQKLLAMTIGIWIPVNLVYQHFFDSIM